MFPRSLLLAALVFAARAAAQAGLPDPVFVAGEDVRRFEAEKALTNAERQSRREALRSSLRSQGEEASSHYAPKQLSPQERAELREQLRRPTPDSNPSRTSP